MSIIWELVKRETRMLKGDQVVGSLPNEQGLSSERYLSPVPIASQIRPSV